MKDQPWLTEPDSLDFTAEGLGCAMRRGIFGVWCGYVGVDDSHPLFSLPYNHPLKLPTSWFEKRTSLDGVGMIDLLVHSLSPDAAKPLEDACPISIALEVHGGITFAGDSLSDLNSKLWWFGFDCGHHRDYQPTIPSRFRVSGIYRNQSYVVSECQSLARQLVTIKALLTKENTTN